MTMIVKTTDADHAEALPAARVARTAALEIYELRRRGLLCFRRSVIAFGVAAAVLTAAIRSDAFFNDEGEPFSLTNGTSAWPAQILRIVALLLVISFAAGLSRQLREAYLTLTRAFRFAPAEGGGRPANLTCAQEIWHSYGNPRNRKRDWGVLIGCVLLYFIGLCTISWAQGDIVLQPVRGRLLTPFNLVVIVATVLGFLLLAFMTITAALNCRRFIVQISEHPTEYPEATRRHFSRQLGRIDLRYLDEWIDLQLIAELTERVGRLVYYPTAILLLLVLARNTGWDAWTWPESLVAIFALNFGLALASVVILQCAARDAKRKAEESLARKVKRLQAETAPADTANNASQATALLDEMRHLRRGAFVPFWENPVVGAIFVSSGGTTLLQLLTWFMSR